MDAVTYALFLISEEIDKIWENRRNDASGKGNLRITVGTGIPAKPVRKAKMEVCTGK